MTIRSLALFDLPLLYRYRDNALPLDGTRSLTRGNPLGALGFMNYLNPARHIYTAIVDGNGPSLLGGITHSSGETFAKLLFLAPQNHLEDAKLPDLLDNLTKEAGNWGALHVIAEIDETSNVFSALRRGGFSVYAWQRMWDISNLNTAVHQSKDWKRVRSVQRPAVQSLYFQIVPPLLHPIEPLSNQSRGLICDGELNCYVSIASGAYGIVLTPLIHPEVNRVGDKLFSLLNCLPERRGRPLYLCVRSYQAWLEPVLADLGALAAQRQAVMVKHLARLVKEEQTVPAVPSRVSVQPSQIGRIDTKE
jgi:hypothetical protein